MKAGNGIADFQNPKITVSYHLHNYMITNLASTSKQAISHLNVILNLSLPDSGWRLHDVMLQC